MPENKQHPLQFKLKNNYIENICVMWDKEFVEKLKSENKFDSFVTFIRQDNSCHDIIQEIYIYYLLIHTGYPIKNIINFHRNRVFTHLSDFIYKLPYPFTEKQLNDEGIKTDSLKKNSSPTSIDEINNDVYKTKRRNILLQPFQLSNYGLSTLIYSSLNGQDSDGYYIDF